MDTHIIDTSICPVCGAGNRCTLADPRTVDQACWCFTAEIDPAILAALPEEVRGLACLCPRCAGLEAASRDAS
ncbi:cysteine-rich CWC family protein [Pseudomonas graminis]|uniref:Helicase n=1 Tax=Pseudomonas graminis TaxID=158627 RepID=A0A1C2D996_9PSED|nr:cysteine-rich CWC family protein [Pseudomonas graminis]OCX11285.1 helicase [Pseudomonas graminis]